MLSGGLQPTGGCVIGLVVLDVASCTFEWIHGGFHGDVGVGVSCVVGEQSCQMFVGRSPIGAGTVRVLGVHRHVGEVVGHGMAGAEGVSNLSRRQGAEELRGLFLQAPEVWSLASRDTQELGKHLVPVADNQHSDMSLVIPRGAFDWTIFEGCVSRSVVRAGVSKIGRFPPHYVPVVVPGRPSD
jgi:hypothetical protein